MSVPNFDTANTAQQGYVPLLSFRQKMEIHKIFIIILFPLPGICQEADAFSAIFSID
jgi:hypothetical protein